MKRIKKSVAVVLSLFMCFTALFITQKITADADYTTMRDISAYDLVAEMNVGINIGNSLDSVGSSETSWGNPRITKELISAYKEAGFNTIRLPVTWQTHIDSSGVPYTAWLNRVQEVVDMILNEGMYCILNTHHEQNWLNTNSSGMESRKTKFENLWKSISYRFRNYGDKLLFEGFNEILKKEGDWSGATDIDYENANTLSQVFVDAVRGIGGNNSNRVLIISTYGALHTTDGFVLPTDSAKNRLAVEFHSYFPQGFCFRWGDYTTWGSDSDNITVENYCRTFYDAFVSKKIPVILGEFGAVNKDNTAAREAYAKKVAETCKTYRIKAVWWDNGVLTGSDKDSFGLINRSTYKNEFPGIVSALVDNSVSVKAPDYSTLPPISTTEKTIVTTTVATTSETFSTAPTTALYVNPVTSVTAEMASVSSVNIDWNPTSDAEFFSIFRSVDNKKFTLLKNTYSNTLTDTGLKRGKVYYYRVFGCKEYAGKTYYSTGFKTVSVSTLASVMSKVNKKAYKNSVLLKYKRVVGADGYEIKYSLKKNLKNAKKKTVKTLKFKINKLKKNKKYYFSVRAYKLINGKKVYTAPVKISIKTKK